MTSYNSTLPAEDGRSASWLWVPYVLIAAIFIVFLGVNFWCYHKRHRQRYLRKRDEKRVKDGLYERRKIIALMRAQFQVKLPPSSVNSSVCVNPQPGVNFQHGVNPQSGVIATVQNGQIGVEPNGSLRQSLEDSLDYADAILPSLSEIDYGDSIFETSSLQNLTFVSTVCSRDIVSSGIGQACHITKRELTFDNGGTQTV